MEALSKYQNILWSVGSCSTVLSYYGCYSKCLVLMSTLSRDIFCHWKDWEKEYKQSLINNKYSIWITRFNDNIVNYLIYQQRYKFLRLNIIIDDLNYLNKLIEFLSLIEEGYIQHISSLLITEEAFICTDRIYRELLNVLYTKCTWTKAKFYDHSLIDSVLDNFQDTDQFIPNIDLEYAKGLFEKTITIGEAEFKLDSQPLILLKSSKMSIKQLTLSYDNPESLPNDIVFSPSLSNSLQSI